MDIMACSSVVEQLTVNQPVAGSNPAGPVCGYNSVVECLLAKENVECSNHFIRLGGIAQLVERLLCK